MIRNAARLLCIAALLMVFSTESSGAGAAAVRFVLGAKPDGGVSGSWGWSSGTYAVNDQSGKVIETGKYLSISKKVGGKWLYVRDTWNADGPAPAAEPATPQKK